MKLPTHRGFTLNYLRVFNKKVKKYIFLDHQIKKEKASVNEIGRLKFLLCQNIPVWGVESCL